MPHPLLGYLLDSYQGQPPPADGKVTVLPAAGRVEAAVAFTGHAIIATALQEQEIRAQQPDGFGQAQSPAFLSWLARGGPIGVLDIVLAAAGTGHGSNLPERSDLIDHPRVRHAVQLRDHVQIWADNTGVVTLADGLNGRREPSIEAATAGN